MSDASQILVFVSEFIPQLEPVMKADVLVVGQSALPIYLVYDLPIRTMIVWHR